MSDDTISRQAAIDAVRDTSPEFYSAYQHNVYVDRQAVTIRLMALPSAERLGQWKHLGGDEWYCTACAHVITTEGSWERPWQKYCEECGAKMSPPDEE